MEVKTGFGYYVKDGLKTDKFELPLGDHPDLPDGMTFVEVPDKEWLDKIVLDPLPLNADQQTRKLNGQIQDQRNAFIDALMAGDIVAQQIAKDAVVDIQAQKADVAAQAVDVAAQVEVKK